MKFQEISLLLGILSTVKSCGDVDTAREALLGCQLARESAVIAQGVVALAKDADPIVVIGKACEYAAAGAVALANVAVVIAEECYEMAKWKAELDYHDEMMKMLNELNSALEKATVKMSSKFKEMEELLGNVTNSVKDAVDKINTIKVYEAKKIWDEVSLNYRILMKEFRLTSKRSELKMFYGYCLSTKLQDPESVFKKMLSILRMENNPFLILAQFNAYTDLSVYQYIAIVAQSCSQLMAAWELCDEYKSNYTMLSTKTRNEISQKRNRLIREIGEAMNAANAEREKLYFNQKNLLSTFRQYDKDYRGYDDLMSNQYTLFYVDPEKISLKKKYIYSVEHNSGGEILKHPTIDIVYDDAYVTILNMTEAVDNNLNTYSIRTMINDPEIIVSSDIIKTHKEHIEKNYKDLASLKTIFTDLRKKCEENIFITAIYAMNKPDDISHYPYYGFGKCEVVIKGSTQLVWCYYESEMCPQNEGKVENLK